MAFAEVFAGIPIRSLCIDAFVSFCASRQLRVEGLRVGQLLEQLLLERFQLDSLRLDSLRPARLHLKRLPPKPPCLKLPHIE